MDGCCSQIDLMSSESSGVAGHAGRVRATPSTSGEEAAARGVRLDGALEHDAAAGGAPVRMRLGAARASGARPADVWVAALVVAAQVTVGHPDQAGLGAVARLRL